MSFGWDLALVATTIVCVVAVFVAPSLIGGEIRAWLPYLARRLARSAARRLPAEARERYERDWLAELAHWEDRPLSALAKAAHLRWKANSVRESVCGVSVKGDRLKRAFDLGFALTNLVVAAPVLLAISIAIWIESPGPIFYREYRVGRDGRRFALLRFRSLYFDGMGRPSKPPAMAAVRFRGEQNPRRTRTGRVLRRFGFEDLPQLFNVLRGEMSVVGPTPLIPYEPPGNELERQRAAVRPGLTGSSQLAAAETDEPPTFDEVVERDAQYVQSRTFLLDLRLLLRTVNLAISTRRAISRRGRRQTRE
jgi:lipopolysaccharide/colanic/teichoic acid biosynthesis glycosyltransferase